MLGSSGWRRGGVGPGSRVSGAAGGNCVRRSVIEEWINMPGPQSECMLMGTMLHSLIQVLLSVFVVRILLGKRKRDW